MQTHCMDQEDTKTSGLEWNLRHQASGTKFVKMRHAENLKPWKDTLFMRYSIKICYSKSQSENTKDRQAMLSCVTLCWAHRGSSREFDVSAEKFR